MPKISIFFRLSRIDKPIGTILIMIPCWWGLAAAQSDIFLYILFGLGAFFMRSFGCIINDWIDCDFDKQVKRTMNRPLASGAVTTNFVRSSAALYLLLGFLIWLYLSNTAKVISIAGLFLCLIYPWMKRITNWPQLMLGLAFNIGILVAYAEVCSTLTWHIVLLYICGICWTLSYDTVYAFQDYEDDILLGIGSTTHIASRNPKVFIGIWMALCLSFFGIWLYFSAPISFWNGILYIILWAEVFHHIWQWNVNKKTSCSTFFKRHAWYGWHILMIILLSRI